MLRGRTDIPCCQVPLSGVANLYEFTTVLLVEQGPREVNQSTAPVFSLMRMGMIRTKISVASGGHHPPQRPIPYAATTSDCRCCGHLDPVSGSLQERRDVELVVVIVIT